MQDKTVIPEPRLFMMIRLADESGVSGKGRICDGVVFHNGKTAICWRTDVEGKRHGNSSIGLYDSYEAFYSIHIAAHPTNKTIIKWIERSKD